MVHNHHDDANPRLPYDILTLIIDQLESKKDLEACSQTCQMLLNPCRVHLFSKITIRKRYGAFVDTVEIADLFKKNSMIPKYVRELCYIGCLCHSDISEDLANVLLLLNNIKTLTIAENSCSLGPGPLQPYKRLVLMHLFSCPSITRIYISHTHLPAYLLSSCSSLKHLTLGYCEPYPFEASDNIFSAPPQLLSLNLIGSCVKWFSVIQMRPKDGLPILDLSSLQSLTIDLYKPKDLEDILRLTSKLEYLEIEVKFRAPHDWSQEIIIVLPTLRSLHLNWFSGRYDVGLAFLNLINKLEELAYRPNCIDQLFIDIEDFDNILLHRDWNPINRVLAGFPKLEQLTIRFKNPEGLCGRGDYLKAKIQANGFEEMKTIAKFSGLFLVIDRYLAIKFTALTT